MYKIILASQSPRRQEILSLGGFSYEVKVSQAEESISEEEQKQLTPPQLVEKLAEIKAKDVFQMCDSNLESDIFVIGADTVVSIDGCVLGKPKSKNDAESMLKMLSGNTHEVYTGVCMIWRGKEQSIQENIFHCLTEVTFYPMTEEEIEGYIDTGDPMDKAGAYGIQSGAAKFIREIHGDYLNVVGLPLSRLYQEMQKHIPDLELCL